MTAYVDFCLELRVASNRRLKVTVRSPCGEHEREIDSPFDLETLPARRDALRGEVEGLARTLRDRAAAASQASAPRDLTAAEPVVADLSGFGESLYEAIFQGTVAELLAASREQAAAAGKGVRVKLTTPDPALALVPWEFLCSRHREYLCLSENTPLVRHLFVSKPEASLRVPPPLRVLGVLSSDGDLNLKAEELAIEGALCALRERRLVEVEWLKNPTSADLLKKLDEKEWHVLHLAGHGTFDEGAAEGRLSMTASDRRAADLNAHTLRTLLHGRPSLRLVFLNSCDGAVGNARVLVSSTAALVTEAGIPAVIAMQFRISDNIAIEFAERVYAHVAKGSSIEKAVASARKHLSVTNSPEWVTPVLFMRSAEGRLLDLTAPPPPPSRWPLLGLALGAVMSLAFVYPPGREYMLFHALGVDKPSPSGPSPSTPLTVPSPTSPSAKPTPTALSTAPTPTVPPPTAPPPPTTPPTASASASVPTPTRPPPPTRPPTRPPPRPATTPSGTTSTGTPPPGPSNSVPITKLPTSSPTLRPPGLPDPP
jgi:CHAT domain-containing protein